MPVDPGDNFELAIVSSVMWKVVPVGLAITGFVSNKQDAFTGSPEQLSVKLMAGVLGPYTVTGMTRLCPLVTARPDGSGANPVTTTGSGLEFPAAKFASPLYCATREFGPAASDEVFVDACPVEFSVPVPSETPFAKKVTAPEGLPEAVLITVADSARGC